MKVRRFTKSGGQRREDDLDCEVISAASGYADDYTVDLKIRTESSVCMVAMLRLSPDEAEALVDRIQAHVLWCRQHRMCETTCGPALGGAHVDGCPLRRKVV